MKHIITIMLIIISLFLFGCASLDTPTPKDAPSPADPKDSLSCTTDDDCTCGGIDVNTGKCFLGNKEYYNDYVDKSKDCPDFCTGIAGNLVTRCIDNECMQVFECISPADCEKGQDCVNNKCTGEAKAGTECSSDKDCATQGCSGQLCRPKSDEPLFTTCDFRPEYECLKLVDCGCIDGKCAWSTNEEYEDCVESKKDIVREVRE